MTTQQPPAYAAAQPQGAVAHQHQVVSVQPGQTAVSNMNQPPPGNWKGIKMTGIAQLVLGSLSVILGIVTMAIRTFLYQVGSPIWCGLLFFIVAGVLGVVAGQKRNSCAAIAYMVMSIFACLASCVVIGFSSGAVPFDLYYCGNSGYYGYGYGFSYYCNSGGHVAVDAMLIILGLVEFVMSIVGASMTCGAVCSTGSTQTVIHYQAQPQLVIAGQPQGTVYYNAPAPQQQYVYPPQQVAGAPQGQFPGAPQGQFQQPPQTYQPQGPGQVQPQAPVNESQYQDLVK